MKDQEDVWDLLPYLKSNKRISIFLKKRTNFYPHFSELHLKSTEELYKILNSLEKNIFSLDTCMQKHSNNILSSTTPSFIKREIANFLIEAETKRICTKKVLEVKRLLQNQKKITKYVKKNKK